MALYLDDSLLLPVAVGGGGPLVHVFTAGTTGPPKAVPVPVRALAAFATARLAVGAGGGTLAAPPPRTNRKLYGDDDPIDDAAFALKVETLREIDAFARSLDCVRAAATTSGE